MFVGLDKLSKEAREVVEEFVKGLESRVDVQILREGNDHQWGIKLKYIDEEGKLIAEETYMTVKSHSRLVAQFVVWYEDDGKHVDDSDWSPMWLLPVDGEDDEDGITAKPKNLSEFVIAVFEQLTPHPVTALAAGIVDEDICPLDDGGDDGECGGGEDDS